MPTYTSGAITDDVYRYLTPDQPGGWDFTLNTVSVGAFSATNYQFGAGIRFINVTIPQGATIDQAYLTLQAAASNSGSGVNTRISAEDVDDAPTFIDDAPTFDARWAARTTARVDWDAIATWVENTQYNSPEIKTVIQEIVDRPGWVSGNDIVIFWDDFEDRSTHGADRTRSADAYAGGFHPQLVIIYVGAAGAPTVTTQAVTAIVTTTATGNGNITSIGSSAVTQHGHVWNTTGSPTTADSKTQKGAGVAGAFTSAMTGLTEGTKYYVKAYAQNDNGITYGSETTFGAARGTIYPIDPLTRVSGIRWVFDAFPGKVADYYMEIFLGGATTAYVPPISHAKPTPAIPISDKDRSSISAISGRAGFQYADYEAWLRRSDISTDTIIRIFGHFPTYADWLARRIAIRA